MLVLGAALAAPAWAQDVVRPADVTGVLVDIGDSDISLVWDAVVLDAAGQPETIDHYNVYRDTTPDFVPDKAGGTNRVGTPSTESFIDLGAGAPGDDY